MNFLYVDKLIIFYSPVCLEQQPRVRGWLLASVDGQTTGLVPANYVKVLGKRRGRKHAEMERLTQVHQDNPQAFQTPLAAHLQSNNAEDFTLGLGAASPLASAEELLESVYTETPVSASEGTSNSSFPSSTTPNVPEKNDL